MVIESIRNNISALGIINQLYKTENRLQSNLERISSGLRINRVEDDPGAFVLSTKLQTQYRGLAQASENTQNALSMTSTASSAVTQTISLLNDVRTAALTAAGTGSAAEQAVISEKLEELNAIANDTKFNDQYLLNGSLTTDVGFKEGTKDFGASIAFGPNATTLFDGRSYLNLYSTNRGQETIKAGADTVYNTGLLNQTDIAVTAGQFVRNGSLAQLTDDLVDLTINRGVSLAVNGAVAFSGVLADGVTNFSGSVSIGGTQTVNSLISSIQSTIDTMETGLEINGTGVMETTVGLDTGTGRLTFNSGSAQNVSQFDIDFTVKNAAGTQQTAFNIDRGANIYNQEIIGTTASGAKIGNNVTAVTGSSFDSGTFDITVSNVLAAQRNQITTDIAFLDTGGAPMDATDIVDTSTINTFTISAGDTFVIDGTDPDGTTFSVTYTVGIDTGDGDAIIQDYGDLLGELNNRDRSKSGYGFNGSVATISAGKIRLIDDIAGTSSTDLRISVSSTTPQVVNSSVDTAGRRETATFSIDGGTAQTLTDGQVATLEGVNASGSTKPNATIRVGSGFSAGDDQLKTTAQEYVGSLNGGTNVTFQNGDQAVTFTSGEASIYPIKQFQQVTMNFDSILDVTATESAGGKTYVLSSSSDQANFHIGMNADNTKSFLFADLRSKNLGTSSTVNLDSINVTTASGASDAIAIIDDALTQVTDFSGRLGAFSSRLSDTVNTLDYGETNLESAYAQIVSADIAEETTEMVMNTVLLQAQAAVLVQANSTPVNVYEILYGLD